MYLFMLICILIYSDIFYCNSVNHKQSTYHLENTWLRCSGIWGNSFHLEILCHLSRNLCKNRFCQSTRWGLRNKQQMSFHSNRNSMQRFKDITHVSLLKRLHTAVMLLIKLTGLRSNIFSIFMAKFVRSISKLF